MPGFQAEVPHALPQHIAYKRIQVFGDRLRNAYSEHITELREEWSEDGTFNFAFKVMGMNIQGVMKTHDDKVAVDGSLPFAALPFRGQLEKEIKSQLQQALEHDHEA